MTRRCLLNPWRFSLLLLCNISAGRRD
ncbi:hypothetical protein E5905_17105 [Salmonella enterica subsp. enterica serovar 4,[5],12:i:-]|nr:hypothetical protein [Salmonella enterica subsp. enterica serovar 4,[5],12:i:-]